MKREAFPHQRTDRWFDPRLPAGIDGRVSHLLETLRPGVVERDRRGSAPLEEAALLRASGLAALTVDDNLPFFAAAAGTDRSAALTLRWHTALSTLRRVARVDLSAAALLGYNFMHLLRIEIAARGAVWQAAVRRSCAAPTLWGGANNPNGPSAQMARVEGGYRLNGRKGFATAAQIADQLVIGELFTAADGASTRLTFVLDAAAYGVRHGDDWNGIGARRSASGSIHFDDVFVPDAAIFSTAPPNPAERSVNESTGALAFQIMFVNLLAGLAQGACDTAIAYLSQRDGGETKAYPSHVQEAIGHSVASAQASGLLADKANDAFAELVVAIDAGTLALAQRGAAADVIAQAKITADLTAHAVTTRVFEAAGARGATLATGLDRYWRDTRIFTLHDPISVKAQEVGAYALSGRPATPSANS